MKKALQKKKGKKQALQNEKGFTLIEILIALMVLGVLAAAAIGGYSMMTGDAGTGAIVQNIQKLKTGAIQYASMNGGVYTGINAAAMQNDGLLPSAWTTATTSATPMNTSIVQSYYVNQDVLAVTPPEDFDIGFTDSALTDSEARTICNDFINQLAGFQYDAKAYPIVNTTTTGTINCANIPNDNTLSTDGEMILGFK